MLGTTMPQQKHTSVAMGAVLLLALASAASATVAQAERIREKVCLGTNGRMSVPSNRDHHYRNLRDRYVNCTYVDGNLELTWLQGDNLDLSFLSNIREITGYLLVSHVDVPRIVLPALQIVRGRTLFKLSSQDDEFALLITLCKTLSVELPALRDILEGSVGIMNNYNLCHIKSIEWKEIITGADAKYLFVYKFAEPERDCTPCHESCEAGCWGEGRHNCQKFSKVNCSPQCHGGRCFGPKPRECCHLFCAGGCTGPKQSDCLSCRNFYDDGVCKQECPPMQIYNTVKYRWERNPEGRYAYGATCVPDCPKHLLKDNGACVRACPPKKKNENGECVPCDGPCPKTCLFSEIVHAGNIDNLLNCTVIEGSITILDTSFTGFQAVHENFTFGPKIPAMDPSSLEVLSTVKEVTGYLNIQANHTRFKTLEAFRNLEIIRGRTQTEYFASLYIVRSSLVSLNLKSLQKISSGNVAILENKDLCFAGDMDWRQILKSPSHNTLLQNNRDAQRCISEGHVCDAQCSAEGCWGPGNALCLACKTYAVEDSCVAACDPDMGLFHSQQENKCMRCDAECELTCRGPGPSNCTRCKNMRDGPFCVEKCPKGKYADRSLRECATCHPNCVDGCVGPENNIGPNGCATCEKAILNAELEVVKCLREEEECPVGYFTEWIVPQVQGKLQALAGKTICRPCHPLCKKCTGYGFHRDVCEECQAFEQDEQCTSECANDYFADQTSKKCIACAVECRGCHGPTVAHCTACKNYKVFAEEDGGEMTSNATEFYCTKKCPDDRPHKVFTDRGEDPYCSSTPLDMAQPLHGSGSVSAIVGGIFGCLVLLGIFMSVFGWHWRKRIKLKEDVNKLAMGFSTFDDSEPLRKTYIRPNLKTLCTITEDNLLQCGILGSGAFGTVYKGIWCPEGDRKVKIPVAIKVLNEGSASAHREIMDEAIMMASMEHENLLPLLAVCMTSQIKLVSELMAFGCLKDYVQNNRTKIGSRHMMNWSLQIARGMAYLEENRLVHRDLAARNVLLKNPRQVKITDFGMAKLLDINQDEYKASGGKMPIKWLALECIFHKSFTHKSDVWAFGVTVWELLSYGAKPYDGIDVRDVLTHLEKGERLDQPGNCTLPLYHILLKCWTHNPEARPSFATLVTEFARMAEDPSQFIVIAGDKQMRLPPVPRQDERFLYMGQLNMDENEAIMSATEYFNPDGHGSQNALHTPEDTPLPPSTPVQKFFPAGSLPPPAYDQTMRSSVYKRSHANDTLVTRGMHYRGADPLRMDDVASDTMHRSLARSMSAASRSQQHNVALPVDDEDYLVPSPHSPYMMMQQQRQYQHMMGYNPYMDLTSPDSGKGSNQTMFPYPPTHAYQYNTDYPNAFSRHPGMGSGFMSMDNPEYILNNNNAGSNAAPDYNTLGIPLMRHSPGGGSSEPTSLQSLPPANGTGYSSLSSNTTSSMVTAIKPYGGVPRPPQTFEGITVATSDSGQAEGSSSTRSSVEGADAAVERHNAFTPPMPPVGLPGQHETTV